MYPVNKKLKSCADFFSSGLFHDVQVSNIFEDSKTFADAIPKDNLNAICRRYNEVRGQQGFELELFVKKHFKIPETQSQTIDTNVNTIEDYLECCWQTLKRLPDAITEDSLMPLPNSYIVPGGRFREIYYWDSYFTALGLAHDGKLGQVIDMMNNFVHLQHCFGHIPNGNRAYYSGRSQPPILALMLELILSHSKDIRVCAEDPVFSRFFKALITEYEFWNKYETGRHAEEASNHCAYLRSVELAHGIRLNRYWDNESGPRPESYAEDITMASSLDDERKEDFYRHIRAACESGWDFSSRWLKDPNDLMSIRTTDLIPVDLNALLYKLEKDISKYYKEMGDVDKSECFRILSQQRYEAIHEYLWDENQGWFCDYNWKTQSISPVKSLAGFVPLFVELATDKQAKVASGVLHEIFLDKGGLATTELQTEQQWDAPNGWAPLQWFSIIGLKNYGFEHQAKEIAERWCSNIEAFFNQHGVMMEKYRVDGQMDFATGGEYDVQIGFGWSNGVYIASKQLLAHAK